MPTASRRAAPGGPRILHLPDGRRLAYAEWGAADGFPLLFFHGGQGSRLERHPDGALAERAGVRLLTMDRPGHGRSDFARRGFLDGADDVAALADALGLARLAVAGWSSGTPFVLACAPHARSGAPRPRLGNDGTPTGRR